MIKIFIALILSINLATAGEIEFTVHHAPGGPSDKITRLLSKKLPQKYLVVNRPGAQGRIAVRYLLSNNTLMVATVPQIFVTNFLQNTEPGYKEDDLEILSVVGTMPSVLACNTKHNFYSFKDLMESSKSLNFGVAGYGSSEHIATEILLKQFPNKHQIVAYAQGGAASLNDLLGGHIDCMFANYPLIKEHIIDTKRIRALITSHDLNLSIPDWRKEFKQNFPFQSVLAIVVSKHMSEELKQQIQNNLESIYNESLRAEVLEVGLFPILSNSAKDINRVYLSNKQLRQTIISNNLKLN